MSEMAPAGSTNGAWRPVRPEDRIRGFSGWDVMLGIDLAAVGLMFLLGVMAGPAGDTAPSGDPELLRAAYWISILLSLALFGALPLLWVAMTRESPWEGTLRWLGIRNDTGHDAWYWFGIGSLLAVAFYGILLLFAVLRAALGYEGGGDPSFEQMARLGGWPLMVAISISAGIGEEILFRGLLQRWLGMWGQAALFGIVHINQGWAAVGFIFVIGLVLGLLKRRGVPLWTLMFAHAAYDMILLGQLQIAVG